MSNTTLVIVIVVAVAVIVAIVIVAYQMARKKRTTRLREQYGPEYDMPSIGPMANARRSLSCETAPSGTKSWSCAVSTPLSVRISSAGGQTYRASSWTTQIRRCATPTSS